MIEKINFEGLPDCYRIFNDKMELIVTSGVGPRIVRFGFIGQQNEFLSHGIRGVAGHRLWHAPEERPRSYIPDKNPVAVEQQETFIRFTSPVEAETGIQKEMDFPLSPDGNHVTVTHRLYNRGLWPVELAPWALSVMAPGGKSIVPLPPRRPSSAGNLLPTSLLAIWEYSDFTDRRFKIGRNYFILGQDTKAAGPLKIGVMDTNNWAAYWNKGHLFLKTFEYKKGAAYPDFGCSVEIFSGLDKLELETVAPLTKLQPGMAVEHKEEWYLFGDVPEPQADSDIEQNILPLIHI